MKKRRILDHNISKSADAIQVTRTNGDNMDNKQIIFNHFSKKSANKKTGPMPVTTTAKDSCPTSCALYHTNKVTGEKGPCYGNGFHVGMHWNKVTSGERGIEWAALLERIAALPLGQKWRHNQVGDLQGPGDYIDGKMLQELVRANKGKRGFTYTHKPLNKFKNFAKVKAANENGFTINVSANTLPEAELYYKRGLPTVAVVPEDHPEKTVTPAGVKMVVCPAQTGKAKDCKSCMLCQQPKRKLIVAFRDHSPGKVKPDFSAFYEYMNTKAAA